MALATGDARFPLVTIARPASPGVATTGSVGLYDRTRQRLVSIATPFPAAETLSALVLGNRLLLGTSGYGLWEATLGN